MDSLAEVTLFVKAGADGKRYGACPFCQRVFMVLLVKANCGLLRFRTAAVNLAKPPEEFKKMTLRRVPAVVHGDTALDSVDDIVQYLDDGFPTPDLGYDNTDAERACKDIFQKFCFFVKEVSKDSGQLETELARLDGYLRTTPTRFLCADHLTHLDCEVLPKLHHVRMASLALKGFHVPPTLRALWGYLDSAYHEDVFARTCPSDQEVILHWADKPETPTLSMEQHSRLAKEEPSYSLWVPGDVQ